MAFKLPINLKNVAQGVGGLVFGSGERGEDDDGGVEPLLERISDGRLADDRRSAMAELRDVVAENRPAQLALGAMGFPILLPVLKEERDDLEMVRGALEVLINGLMVPPGQQTDGQVVPGLVNSELLAREPHSVALLLSLLEEEDFYVRYHTVQLLTLLLTNSPHRVQEAILQTAQGVVRLMDMLQEREVIRNEALLLLVNLTRSAEEIQKIAAFEGAFERVWAIIKEEGGADGGIVVQDCLELLNNLLRNNPSNQVLLRETLGFQQVPALLKLRKGDGDGLSRQKAANLLCALETVALLLARGSQSEGGRDSHLTANQTSLQQAKLMDALLALAVEGRITSVAVRTQALRALGSMVAGHPGSREELGSKMVGEEPEGEPALNRVLRSALRATNPREWAAAEFVFKCYCEANPDGQSMLASTITPLPHAPPSRGGGLGGGKGDDDPQGSTFGSMLARALLGSDGRQDLEASCRAASVLAHVLKDNNECKERVLRIPLELPSSALAPPDLLLPRCMRYLAAAASPSPTSSSGYTSAPPPPSIWLQPVLLRLLITWLADCPAAVAAFLGPPAHLPFLIDLTASSGSAASVHVAGLATVLLGVCLVSNRGLNGTADNATVLDVVTQRVGLSSFFSKWEDMKRSALFVGAMAYPRLPKPLTRATAAAAAAGDGMVMEPSPTSSSPAANGHREEEGAAIASTFFDPEFTTFVGDLEQRVRDQIMKLYARPKGTAPAGEELSLAQREGESVEEYAARLRRLAQSQAEQLRDLQETNTALAEEAMAGEGGLRGQFTGESGEDGVAREEEKARSLKHVKLSVSEVWAETERLRQELADAEAAQQPLQSELTHYRQLAAKHEADLQALSSAYNALEQDNFQLESQLREATTAAEAASAEPAGLSEETLEAARQDGREEAQKESETELNDLLVCLGQEETKVQKLRARLLELGEDVDALLEGIGDAEDGDEDEDEGGEEEEEEEEEHEGGKEEKDDEQGEDDDDDER